MPKVGKTMDRKAARKRVALGFVANPLDALKDRAQELGRPLTAQEGLDMLDPLLSCLTPEERERMRRQTSK